MTSKTTYENRHGERAAVIADFSQASSTITIEIRGRVYQTPYQVADARHRRYAALRLAVEWLRSNYGAI